MIFLDNVNVHHFLSQQRSASHEIEATDKVSVFSIYGDRNKEKHLAAEGSTSLFCLTIY
jgi:hypothetical protein